MENFHSKENGGGEILAKLEKKFIRLEVTPLRLCCL